MRAANPEGGTVENTLSIEVRAPFKEALRLTKGSLAHHGFTIISDADVAAALGGDAPRQLGNYQILGVLNTALARGAVEMIRDAGVVLPVNVVVRQDPQAQVTRVHCLTPDHLMRLYGPELRDVAVQTSEALDNAIRNIIKQVKT